MTSINTNYAAVSALQTLRSINSNLQTTQNQVSSGLRVGKASDNAAYWSIATTMRSDSGAVSAISDALGIASAKVDTAYEGISDVVDTLGQFKAKLVSAEEDSVDKSKVQDDLDQLKQQVMTIANSSSFGGVNYLQTNIDDIYDPAQSTASVSAAFVRSPDGSVAATSNDFDLSQISLFNSGGGGLLQADPRDLGTIGGLHYDSYTSDTGVEVMSTSSAGNTRGGGPSGVIFNFTGPMDFSASDEISFDVTVDADNPADNLPGAQDSGTTAHVVINQATVNAALGVSDGHVETYTDYTTVLNTALRAVGAYAGAGNFVHPDPPDQDKIYVPTIDVIGISREADSSKNGSSFQISNLNASAVGTGGLVDTGGIKYGTKSSSMTLAFDPFTVYSGVEVSFDFSLDNQGTGYTFDRDYVNKVLGKDNGEVSTSAEMATLLNSLIDRPDVLIADNGSGGVSLSTDVNLDRKSGEKSSIGFTGINVNIEPIPRLDFMGIDVEKNPEDVSTYIDYIETVSQRVTQAGAILGSLTQRIDAQTEFAAKLKDSIDTGVGRLVDADMEEESSRLSALQTQQQLAVQSLSIANTAPQTMLSLFR